MLYLTRRVGEAVIINNAIEVRVVELKGKSVKLGFNFPSSASVLREEIHRQISQANEAAAATMADLPHAGPEPASDPVRQPSSPKPAN